MSYCAVPELLVDAAVDDEVDGGVEDEEDVVGGVQVVEVGGRVQAAQAVAEVEVVLGDAERVQQFVELHGEDVRVAQDEDQHDGHCKVSEVNR